MSLLRISIHPHITAAATSSTFSAMASSSSSFSLSPPRVRSHPFKPLKDHHLLFSLLSVPFPSRFPFPLRASRNYPNYSKEAVVVVPDPRAWVGDFGAADGRGDLDDDDDEEEKEEDDRSLDLFARLLQNMFWKISRQARRAVRSVLPPSISTKLVRFTVNGVLILAFLWLLKAFLEVVCMVGSMVFVSILLLRGIWSGLSYIKENQLNYIYRINKFNNNNSNSNNAWNGVQPVG